MQKEAGYLVTHKMSECTNIRIAKWGHIFQDLEESREKGSKPYEKH